MKTLRTIAFIIVAVMTLTALPLSVLAADDLISIQYTPIVAPDGVAQGGVVEKSESAPVVISFEGQSSFEKNGMFKTYGGNEHGVYEFVKLSDGTQCLKLGYNKNMWWENYRAIFTFKDAGAISSDYKYACITYMTNDSEAAFLRLTNTADHNDNAVFSENTTASGGGWIVSYPTEVSNKIIDSLAKGPALNCAIEYSAENENSAVYIKELVFFSSEEQALKYYGNDVRMEKPQDDSENLPAPVIMSFEGEEKFSANAMFKNFSGNQHGVYEFVTLDDGTRCLKLNYHKFAGWANYRVMPAFKNENTVNDAYKYMRITYMTESALPATIRVTNNANHADMAVLVPDVSVSNGQWKTSNAAFIAGGDIVKRWSKGSALHCTIEYTADVQSDALYIKELAFFATEEQAYAYYGDSKQVEVPKVYSVMTFGEEGNANVNNDNPTFGKNSLNPETNAIDIVHGQGNFYGIKYMAKLRFTQKNCIDTSESYIRVLYSAENPAGTTGVSLFMLNDGDKELIELQKDVQNTNGEFVLSDTVYLPANIVKRLAGSSGNPLHVSFCSTAKNAGGRYSIKAVYFFPSREAANSFRYSADETVTISVNGTDIGNYVIVVPANPDRFVTAAAETLAKKIKSICGAELTVVTDDGEVTPYEILLGSCDRPESEVFLEKAAATGERTHYEFGVMNGKIVINAVEHIAVKDGAEIFVDTYLRTKILGESAINIDERYNHGGSGQVLTMYGRWEEIGNVDSPKVITDDFSTDMKYFTEDGGADSFKIENGKLTLTAKEERVAYVLVYESNVRLDARMKYTQTDADGEMGLTLRNTAPDAYIRGGWDKAIGEWYIQYREGTDFAVRRVATKSYDLTPDTWYDVALTANGQNVTLEVNGEAVLNVDGVVHVTPGKVGIFADGMTVAVDDVKIALLSGEGTVLRGVEHTRLPGEQYREGGTVIEMTDGSLKYETHHSNAAFESLDGGKTWTSTAPYFNVSTYPQVLRLNNGDLLNIVQTKVDGTEVRLARLSSDDGKTWRDGGVVCPHKYSGLRSLNMNDKVTQSATTGRIYYSQNYDGGSWNPNGTNLRVFCVFFYSDDNGMTWHESETGSWEISGNEKQERFGESKIIECADGTLRMYNSWNDYPCIVYSESTDNGVTWGPLQKLSEFVCTRSSMQIVRDTYSDNDTAYYMVWVNCDIARSRLSLAKSEDGKNWTYIGDLWRWESPYRIGASGLPLNHIVDPFVSVSRDKILVGAGIAEYVSETGTFANGHGELRQHIWSIDRDGLGA